ncbi:MAG: hypothetical protein JNK05_10230 [Myxococcales bacterium]|nr:hypothetical protein [Myxococcales bacterium]
MIDAVALGPKSEVFSIFRHEKKSRVQRHTSNGAEVLFETSDKLYGLCVTPSGEVLAGGKGRVYSSNGPKWKHSKLDGHVYSLWSDGAALFAGTLSGDCLRWSDGAWTTIREGSSLVNVFARSATDVYFTSFDGAWRWDGATMKTLVGPWGPGDVRYAFQGACPRDERSLWLCGHRRLFTLELASNDVRAASDEADSEIYGVGANAKMIVVHHGTELLALDGQRLVTVWDERMMLKNATYSTQIASDGKRIVAGAPDTVIVHDGERFEAWPAR